LPGACNSKDMRHVDIREGKPDEPQVATWAT
jgi:hypothetical protein